MCHGPCLGRADAINAIKVWTSGLMSSGGYIIGVTLVPGDRGDEVRTTWVYLIQLYHKQPQPRDAKH